MGRLQDLHTEIDAKSIQIQLLDHIIDTWACPDTSDIEQLKLYKSILDVRNYLVRDSWTYGGWSLPEINLAITELLNRDRNRCDGELTIPIPNVPRFTLDEINQMLVDSTIKNHFTKGVKHGNSISQL